MLPSAAWRTMLLRSFFSVVLFLVDLVAGVVLFAIDVLLLRRRQSAAVRSPVCVRLAIDVLLTIFRSGSFAGRHLTALDALRDSLLLFGAAIAHLVVAVLCVGAVVFVGSDGMVEIVLLPVYLLPLLRRKRAAVGCPVGMNLAIHVGLTMFKILRFTSRETSGGDPVGNSPLLIEAASIDRIHGGGRGPAVIQRSKLGAVLGRDALMVELIGGRLEMLFV